jgi:hypothetical protein
LAVLLEVVGGDSSSSLFYFVLLLLSIYVPSASLFLLLFLTVEVLLSTIGRNGGNWWWLCGKHTVVLPHFSSVSTFPPLCLPLIFPSFFASVSLLFPLCFHIYFFFVFFFVLSNPSVRSFKIFRPTSLFSSPSIYKQKEREPSLLCPIVVQGGSGVTLSLQGKVAARLQGMVPLSFIYQVGRVCGSMNCVGGGEREKMNSKTLLPLLHVKGKKKQPSAVQNDTV